MLYEVITTIAAHLTFKLEDKQELLEVFDPILRLEKLYEKIQSEAEILRITSYNVCYTKLLRFILARIVQSIIPAQAIFQAELGYAEGGHGAGRGPDRLCQRRIGAASGQGTELDEPSGV